MTQLRRIVGTPVPCNHMEQGPTSRGPSPRRVGECNKKKKKKKNDQFNATCIIELSEGDNLADNDIFFDVLSLDDYITGGVLAKALVPTTRLMLLIGQ